MPYSLEALYDDTAQIQHDSFDVFGSGRLIARNLVLTARHIVTPDDPSAPVSKGWQVRMISGRPASPDVDKWTWIPATLVWTGREALDLALLQLLPPTGTPDLEPKLALRIARIDEVEHHKVRAIGFPRGAKLNNRRTLFVPSGDLDDEKGSTLSFGIDQAYQPESPGEDWRGFSGSAVMLAEGPDPQVIWIYGVAQEVPPSFNRRLAVSRLATAWADERFQAVLQGAGIRTEPPVDPGRLVSQKQITLYTGPAYARRDYSAETQDLFEFHTRLFVDRESELGLLTGLANQQAGGYTLLESQPAFGKSALLAHAIEQLLSGTAKTDVHPRIIYFFVRQQGQRNAATEFLSVVNAQLLTSLGLDGGVPPELGALRAQFTALWRQASAQSDRRRPLMFFVDGLDEAAQEQVGITQLLPGTTPPWVHVIVSCRIEPSAATLVPLEHPLQRPAQTVRLNALSQDDVLALISQLGAAALATAKLAERIIAITKGEPLMTRFVSEEVASGGLDALVRLEKAPPRGAQAYFAQQMEQLRASSQYQLTRDVLSVLLVALGGMTTEELADALKAGVWVVGQAIQPVRRFLIGRERFELMHIYFRRELERQFGSREQKNRSAMLLEWCTRYEKAGWPDDTPDYVLSNYVRHLQKNNDFEHIYRLISPAWMTRRWTQTHSYSGYVDDVFTTMETAASEQPSNLFQQVRAAMLVGQLVSGLDDLHPAALAALARINQVDRALSYVTLIGDAGKRVEAALRIANACWESDVGFVRSDTSAKRDTYFWGILGGINEYLNRVLPMRLRVDQLSRFASLLATIQWQKEALHIAKVAHSATVHIERPESQAAALVGVAGALADAGARDQLPEISRQATDASAGLPLLEQNTVRLTRAVVLTNAGLTAAADDLLRLVDHSATVEAIKASNWRCNVAFDLVRAYLALRKPEDAFAIAEASPQSLERAGNFAQIALDYRNRGQTPTEIEKHVSDAIRNWMDANERPSDNQHAEEESEYSFGHSSYTRHIILPHTLALEGQVVRYLVTAGSVERLQRYIERCPRPEQLRLLAVLSDELALAGRKEEAESTALRSLGLTKDADLDRALDEFRMEAGSQLAALDALEEAEHIAGFIRNRGRKRVVGSALALQWEKRGQPAKAAELSASATVSLPAGQEDRFVVQNVIVVRLRMREYESALQLAESIQNWDVRMLALALVADLCLRESVPQGKMALDAMLKTMQTATPDDRLSHDTLYEMMYAFAAAGYSEDAISTYALQTAQSAAEGDRGVFALQATVLFTLSKFFESATWKERARSEVDERLKSADFLSKDLWNQMAEYGMAARLFDNAGLVAEAEVTARQCLDAFRKGVTEWHLSG
jgi:hypothetical protein